MKRLLLATLLLALPPAGVAQSLGEIAERDKQKKAKAGAKVFTNDDLAQHSSRTKGSPAPSPTPTEGKADEKADEKGTEAQWRGRADGRRVAIRKAEARVKGAEDRLAALTVDMDPNPSDIFDPNRLQKIEAQKAQAREELEAAKAALAEAQKALEDLEEEARRKSVPPGWLRE